MMTPKIQPYLITLLFLCSVFSNNLFAIKSPMKFGNPEMEELEMTVYELDSTADAVILCNFGYFDAMRFEFIHTMRFKILKKSGTDWGSNTFSSMGNDTRVRGKTFNLENGEIIESKLKNESIFKERIVGNYYDINIAMPNVKVGSVIDLEVASTGIPHVWKFQELIPIRHSELMIESSQYIDYQKNFFGFIPFDVSTSDHWVVTDVPAFKIEPYMDSYKNYISKIEFDIRSISFPGFYEDFASTWEEVGETLLESDYFGAAIRSGDGYLKDIEEEICNTCSSDYEKLQAAYEKIKMVKWNDEIDNSASTTSLSLVFKKKIGNSADINFLLIKLLNKLNIKAYPVVLSTRKNGQLSPFFPSLNKLNYTICCAILDDQKILLDPTEEKLPIGLLPERVLNNKGRLIYSKEKTEWVSISTEKKDAKKVFQQLKLNTDNTITGKRMISYEDYGAFKKRNEIAGFNSQDDYLGNYETENAGLEITDFEIRDKDDISKKLVEIWTINLNRHVEEIGDLLMVNLNVFEQLKENPFKLEKRDYPVNYPYCYSNSNTIKLDLPEGYAISELPADVAIGLPGGAGSFVLKYATQNNSIVMNCLINIDKKLFLPEEYLYLKEFFTQIVKKQAEPVILKKV